MILDKIIRNKRKKISENKKRLPLARMKSTLKKSNLSFKKAISKGFCLIAEIKKMSPVDGVINEDFDFEHIAKAYGKNKKVKVISVLTDNEFFGGDKSLLMEAKRIAKKPILRKDFIIDEYQVYESRYYGADAILLIARLLAKEKMRKFISLAKRYGMDCLIEIHTKDESRKLPENADIIGINNRDLDSLKVDMDTTLKLLKCLPKDKVIVAESGFETKKDVDKVKGKVDAVLIGTSLIRAKDINEKINELFGK